MDVAESMERRQFNDGFDLSFKQNRQHNDVQRRRFAQSGIDVNVVRRYVREKDRFFFERALSDKSFSGFEAVRNVLTLAVCIAGEQFHIGIALLGTFVEVEDAMLHRNQWSEFRQDKF